MRFSYQILVFSVSLAFCADFAHAAIKQTPKIRNMCKDAQDLEKKISKEENALGVVSQKEKISTPAVKNMYEMLTRCFTVLFDMQRFSNILILNQNDRKNDFVRCSIIIKNFTTYFKLVGRSLRKTSSEIAVIREERKEISSRRDALNEEYEKIVDQLNRETSDLAKNREENFIQNDVVYHLASKSESIEELDAELEAENAIGVLKSSKISSTLSLVYPVRGRIAAEFGDRGPRGEMIYHIAFETRPGAVVTSPANGQVVFSGKFLNYGNMVIISNGDYRVFLYGMDAIFSCAGDIVEKGDYIGRMSLETTSVPLIKMELKKSGEPLDPRAWLSQATEMGNSK
ncbi:MAG: peptidoglycan DD-metalloendopeptidase family protein [Holosporaceae bacterium]|jgi:septal ring factor EnvC (AmiA/AmiB activator)|nr:peptidoglycan DD-metalloendopeptidase family protein [Holosporaceae bacterium]